MNALEGMLSARHRRSRIFTGARLLNEIKVAEGVDKLNWQRLADLPPWTFIKHEDKDLFCLLTGCFYYAAAIKRCIRGDMIKHIRALVGNDCYDAILDNCELAKNKPDIDMAHQSTRDHTLQNKLIGVGAALVVQASDNAMQPYVQAMFIDASQVPLSIDDTREAAAIVVQKSWQTWSNKAISNNA